MQCKRRFALLWVARAAFVAAASAAVVAFPWSDSHAQAGPSYTIDVHLISTGGRRVRTSCFILNGTVGQAAPGYSSGGSYSILAGFWPATTPVRDEIFFDGFERC
jgi:hypothetical protein